jgi:hypothetical protein
MEAKTSWAKYFTLKCKSALYKAFEIVDLSKFLSK